MAFVITDSCVSCGSCAGECPVGAISQGDGKYDIDANSCIDCGTCAGVCPTGAIEQGSLCLLQTVRTWYVQNSSCAIHQESPFLHRAS